MKGDLRLKLGLAALALISLAGCARGDLEPNVQLGLQLSKAVCVMVTAEPRRDDGLARACRAFLGVQVLVDSAPPTEPAPPRPAPTV